MQCLRCAGAPRRPASSSALSLHRSQHVALCIPGEAVADGTENVEFLKGDIENIPLPDNSVDVIISNCVMNLSAAKDKVLCEAFRVLKPDGRFAVSDVVTRGEISPKVRESVLLWVGCIADALDETEYRDKLAAAGFEQIEFEQTRVYRAKDARDILTANGLDANTLAADLDGKFFSAFVRAVKLSMTI